MTRAAEGADREVAGAPDFLPNRKRAQQQQCRQSEGQVYRGGGLDTTPNALGDEGEIYLWATLTQVAVVRVQQLSDRSNCQDGNKT